MEHLTQHLQLVATRADVAQFQQWLSTCMLYVQAGVTPTVEAYPHPPRTSLLQGIVWNGWHVRVPKRALQEIPPYPLALLAVRNYMEATARRRLMWRSIALTVFFLLTIPAAIYTLTRSMPEDASSWLLHLAVLVPLEWTWRWWHHLARQIDWQFVEQIGEADDFLLAMQMAIKIDLKAGVRKNTVDELLERLNALRREEGYPELSEGDLLPTPPPQEDGQEAYRSPAIDKEEFLHRHPPDEYNRVDRITI